MCPSSISKIESKLTERQSLYHKMYDLLRFEQKRRLLHQKRYDWSLNAREAQKEPGGDWKVWLILAGRGFGKTRTGAETMRSWVASGRAKRMALVAHSLDDARKVMVEGESGLLSVCPESMRPTFYPSRGVLVWPCGATATLYSAAHHEKLRGPQFDGAWVDELAKFENPEDTFDQLMLGLRLGHRPRVIVTTTPKPLPFLKKLSLDKDTIVTRGSTFDNRDNLSASYMKTLTRRYEGTSLGRQEIEGQFVEAQTHHLWTDEMIHACRLPNGKKVPKLLACVVAIDPSVTAHANSDEAGIVVVGVDQARCFYVLDDLSGRMDSLEWGRCAIDAYRRFEADAIVAEVNNGGDLVERLIHDLDQTVCVRPVRALRSKWQRAEPIAALYQQGRVCHTRAFDILEEQMLSYTPHALKSPDRLDALVWAVSELVNWAEKETPSSVPSVWTV